MQQFAKSSCRLCFSAKILKIHLQQFGKKLDIFLATWEKSASNAKTYARGAGLASWFL
jgi:hypothetical protein